MAPGFAFFDFDHTLIDADAGPRFGRHLLRVRRDGVRERHGRVTSTVLRLAMMGRLVPFTCWMGAQAALYKVGARRRSSIVRSAYRGLAGVPAAMFREELATFVHEEIPDLIFPEMVAEIERHAAEGRRSVVITTGMEPLVELALPLLPDGVDLLGCRLEERKGRLTGRVEGPLYGADKANIIHAYCRAAGADPADCWAYSDHWSDLEMLEAVGHPVVVNARGKLRRHAERQGWRILDPAARDA